MQALQITGEGTGVTTSGTSQAITIPNDSSGNKARTVLVTVEGSTYVLPGIAATATAESIIVSNAAPMVFNVVGLTTISVLQLTAGQVATVTPVEY